MRSIKEKYKNLEKEKKIGVAKEQEKYKEVVKEKNKWRESYEILKKEYEECKINMDKETNKDKDEIVELREKLRNREEEYGRLKETSDIQNKIWRIQIKDHGGWNEAEDSRSTRKNNSQENRENVNKEERRWYGENEGWQEVKRNHGMRRYKRREVTNEEERGCYGENEGWQEVKRNQGMRRYKRR